LTVTYSIVKSGLIGLTRYLATYWADKNVRTNAICFGGVYAVKRLQPGKVRGRGSTPSFGKKVSVGTHDSSTLGGNSGSAVIDPRTGHVVALHFAGIYLKENYAVPMCDLAEDQRVVDRDVILVIEDRRVDGAKVEWWHKATTEAAGTPTDSTPQTVPAAGTGRGSDGR
jgi:NAD(P)-dependent dehydrogenase (short-subunit alcohol dehydrogenase family)